MRRRFTLIAGWFVVALGILIWPLPGPGGLPVVVAGLTLVLGSSQGARRRFVRLKRRYPVMMTPVRRLLRRNRPRTKTTLS